LCTHRFCNNGFGDVYFRGCLLSGRCGGHNRLS
jgi:hypothetical protein